MRTKMKKKEKMVVSYFKLRIFYILFTVCQIFFINSVNYLCPSKTNRSAPEALGNREMTGDLRETRFGR